MISLNELRRGNLFNPVDRSNEINLPVNIIYKVIEIKAFSVSSVRIEENPAQVEKWPEFDVSDLSPIPLTPEMCYLLGFQSEDDSDCVFTKGGFTINFHIHYGTIDYNGNRIVDTWGNEWIKDKVPVHKLQNLYFALTGEEIEIKDLKAKTEPINKKHL